MESDSTPINLSYKHSFCSSSVGDNPNWTVYVRIRGPLWILPKAKQRIVNVRPNQNTTFKDVLDQLQVPLTKPEHWEIEALRHRNEEDRPRANLNLPIKEIIDCYQRESNVFCFYLVQKQGLEIPERYISTSAEYSRDPLIFLLKWQEYYAAAKENKNSELAANKDVSKSKWRIRIRGSEAVVPESKQETLVLVPSNKNITFQQVLEVLEINLANPNEWEIEGLRYKKPEDRPRLNLDAPIQQIVRYYVRKSNDFTFYLVPKSSTDNISHMPEDGVCVENYEDEPCGNNNDIQYLGSVAGAGVTAQNVRREVIHHIPAHVSNVNFGTSSSHAEYDYHGSYHSHHHHTPPECVSHHSTAAESCGGTEIMYQRASYYPEPLTTPWTVRHSYPEWNRAHLPARRPGARSGLNLHFGCHPEPQNRAGRPRE